VNDFERKMLAERRCGFCGAKVVPTTDEQRDFVRQAVERGGPALQCAECARSQRTLYGDGPGDDE